MADTADYQYICHVLRVQGWGEGDHATKGAALCLSALGATPDAAVGCCGLLREPRSTRFPRPSSSNANNLPADPFGFNVISDQWFSITGLQIHVKRMKMNDLDYVSYKCYSNLPSACQFLVYISINYWPGEVEISHNNCVC